MFFAFSTPFQGIFSFPARQVFDTIQVPDNMSWLNQIIQPSEERKDASVAKNQHQFHEACRNVMNGKPISLNSLNFSQQEQIKLFTAQLLQELGYIENCNNLVSEISISAESRDFSFKKTNQENAISYETFNIPGKNIRIIISALNGYQFIIDGEIQVQGFYSFQFLQDVKKILSAMANNIL